MVATGQGGQGRPNRQKPVMFQLGRSSPGTRPLATGSLTFEKTIGVVRVSPWTATEPTAWSTAPVRHHQIDLPIIRAKIMGPQ